MAGVEHLERMGRELKCPICLSLLRSAVSLSCNHVFCSTCIKSMKSASNCPVCKVPYHRREIRPSPHMDNLVTVYKSMEVAAGVNIFVTQREQANKDSDEPIHGGDNKSDASRDTDKKCRSKSKKTKALENKSKDESVAETIVTNPSKKRVHVTPYPVSETPLKSEELLKHGDSRSACQIKRDFVNNMGDKARNIATISKDKVSVNEKGEPTFDPFFWLREDVDDDEALERPSAQLSEDMPPQEGPCFSDIKDTDDGNPNVMTPVSKSHVERIFDSELFEWTQRACSPELCFTPTRNQIIDEHELDKVLEKEHETATMDEIPDSSEILISKGVKSQKGDEANGNSNCCQSDNPRKQTTKRKQTANLISRRNAVKKSDVRKKTCLDHAMAEAHEQHPSEGVEAESYNLQIHEVLPCQKTEEDNSRGACGKRKRNTLRSMGRERKMASDDAIGKPLAGVNPKFGEKETGLPVSKSLTTELDEGLNSINGGSRWDIKDYTVQQKKPVAELNGRNPMADHARGRYVTTAKAGRSYKTVDSGNEDDKLEKTKQRKKRREPKMQRKVVDRTKELGTVEDSEEASLPPMISSENRNSGTTSDLQQNGNDDAARSSLMTLEMPHASRDHSLKKCFNVPFRTKCAFCQSDKETEVTGNMMHYFNGNPVAADYNGGNNVVHSHKHCAEWAPNVYFQDSYVVNLATELARSKRIKCSCCGIKGAALGCFEKSCRKSFHYACAKLIQQCRWDTENFVMLCPLHPSSKLPCEISESHHRRTQSTAKRESQPHATTTSQTSVSVRQLWRWPSGSPFKCVVCCSALSIAEKEVVSEFAKVSGASVLKNWSPTVTHVIASTDENGACKRTFKFLMAILEGKWILKIDWVKASVKAGAPQDEEQYEIKLDVHGTRHGPQLGRLRAIKQEPKIFNGFNFYFSGDFTASYKGFLHDLVIAAGGTILQRKPISREKERLDDTCASPVFVVYSLELHEKCNPGRGSTIFARRRAEAVAIADASGAKVATNTWILDSLAGCKMQSLDKC